LFCFAKRPAEAQEETSEESGADEASPPAKRIFHIF
jgi:hypothetical protein